jgi:rubredoxin
MNQGKEQNPIIPAEKFKQYDPDIEAQECNYGSK